MGANKDIDRNLEDYSSMDDPQKNDVLALEENLRALEEQLAVVKAENVRYETECQQLKNRLDAIQSSKFWRIRNKWFSYREKVGILESIPLSDIPKGLYDKVNTKLNKAKRKQADLGWPAFLLFAFRRLILNTDSEYTLSNFDDCSPDALKRMARDSKKLNYKPKISIIVPVYNVEQKWLDLAVTSVLNQVYPYWELCLADDASTAKHIRPLLEQYESLDSRIRVAFSSENGGISSASNLALSLATGEYIALLDNDDELAPNALYENAKLINQFPEADFIYSDEDKIDAEGKRRDPFFKPDWSPEYFHSCMYTCHLGVYRTSLVRRIDGFRSEYDGAQDWDLVLRFVEQTKNIHHIPKILYHWRILPSSSASGEQAKPWAYIAAKKALTAMVERSNYSGWIENGPSPGFYQVRRHIIDEPLVSVIIPSAAKTLAINGIDETCLLEQCLHSINQISTYSKIELIIVDGYDIPEEILKRLRENYEFKLIRCDKPFNFSMRMNLGAEAAMGSFLLMLNDDTKVITPDWIQLLLEFAQQREIGAVGCKLLFPSNKIQHCGVTLLDGHPGHPYYNYHIDHPGYFLSNSVNRNYLAVTGACLMLEKSKFYEVGKFNETLPLNYNDVDLCLNLVRFGYRNVVVPSVKIYHFESVSRGDNWQKWELDKLHELHANMGYLEQDPYFSASIKI